MLPISSSSCWDLFPEVLRWYPFFLYLAFEPYRSAEDPERKLRKRGLRQGMQAAMMAVQISIVVLGKKGHFSCCQP